MKVLFIYSSPFLLLLVSPSSFLSSFPPICMPRSVLIFQGLIYASIGVCTAWNWQEAWRACVRVSLYGLIHTLKRVGRVCAVYYPSSMQKMELRYCQLIGVVWSDEGKPWLEAICAEINRKRFCPSCSGWVKITWIEINCISLKLKTANESECWIGDAETSSHYGSLR